MGRGTATRSGVVEGFGALTPPPPFGWSPSPSLRDGEDQNSWLTPNLAVNPSGLAVNGSKFWSSRANGGASSNRLTSASDTVVASRSDQRQVRSTVVKLPIALPAVTLAPASAVVFGPKMSAPRWSV